nr:amidohydrolase family protein [Akkermansiaceae bacterium]
MKADTLVIRNARVVEPHQAEVSDVLIEDGRIAAVGDFSNVGGAREIDASGQVMFPGLVDMHVHFNDPGRADWEGMETGSAALAAGGGTVFADMPLNSHPPVLDRETFIAKRVRGEAAS